jgi:tetratricopeptide (TPR) repeat protein
MDLLFKTTDLAAAAPLYDRALKSAPNNSEILRQLGRFAYILERYEESHALLERAVAIDPLCSHCLYFLSRAYMISRDWDKAEEARDRYLLLGGRGGYLHYGTIKLMQGKADEALEIFTDPDKVDEYQAAFGQALALFSLGRSAEADVALARMIDERGELATHDVAKVYAWRNQPDVAFEWLDKFADLATGDEDHRFGMVNSVHSPLYQNLHDDPRWETYRERAGLSTGLVESIEIDLSIPE